MNLKRTFKSLLYIVHLNLKHNNERLGTTSSIQLSDDTLRRLAHLVAEDIREHTQAQVSTMTSLVDQMKNAFVGFMDKA